MSKYFNLRGDYKPVIVLVVVVMLLAGGVAAINMKSFSWDGNALGLFEKAGNGDYVVKVQGGNVFADTKKLRIKFFDRNILKLSQDVYIYESAMSQDFSCSARLNDGYLIEITGKICYLIGQDNRALVSLHRRYGGQDKFNVDVIHLIRETFIYTAAFMSTEEYRKENGEEYLMYVWDQLKYGRYVVDNVPHGELTVTSLRRDTDGQFARHKHPFQKYDVSFVSIEFESWSL
ncbi:hypothetical protein KAU09_01265 [Candidatus Parcubacteria bacterium]|nr:hypothetical protein [Candidatus Parcubacteria bacterium]